MLWLIVRNEWRNLTADRSIQAAGLLLIATVLYGAWNGANWADFQAQRRAALTVDYQERIADLRAQLHHIARGGEPQSRFRDPRNPAVVGQRFAAAHAVLPPRPLAPLSIGQSDLLPGSYKVTLDKQQLLFASEELENPTNLLSGRFDVAFVLVYLYPLVILALSYGLVSSEKEQGTLALTLSQPVPLTLLAVGKVIARGIFALGLSTLLILTGALIAGVELTAGGAVERLALWIGVVAAYGLFWFALAAAVNTWGASSATNALALAGCWLVLTLVVPSSLGLVASTLYPVPSRVEMIQAMREASQEASGRGSQILQRYYEDHPELLPDGERNSNDYYAQRYAVEQEVDRRVAPVSEEFARQISRQQRLVERFRYLSPAVLAQEAFNDLAGTSYARHRHFEVTVAEFAQRWRDYFFPQIFRRVVFTSNAIPTLPKYEYSPEPPSAWSGRVLVNLLALLAPSVIIAGFAAWRMQRYSVA